MENNQEKYFVPTVKVHGVLKKTQRVGLDKYKITHRGENKYVLSENVEFYVENLQEAIDIIIPEEFESLTIIYNEQ